jgi:hypothetical protein
MRRWLLLLTTALFLACLGCGGGDKDRGINSNKDKPRTTATD